jgi:membrane protein required for colicin V production
MGTVTTATATTGLTIYDIVFLGIILVSAIFATIRGGIAELLSLSVWFIALWAMHQFGAYLNHYIPNNISNQLIRSAIVYLTLFIIVAIIVSLIKKLIAPIINNIGLNGLNYLLGFIFGIVRGVIICAIIIVVIEMLSLDGGHTWQNSKLYPIIQPIIIWIVDIIKNTIHP